MAIERHVELSRMINKRFSEQLAVTVINDCFLEYTERVMGGIYYPKIIMNPPFYAVKKHIKAALSFLGASGHDLAVLVALVPITFEHDEAETLEELPRDTFITAAVSTKIIRVWRD